MAQENWLIIKAKDLQRWPDFAHLSLSSLYRHFRKIRDFAGKERKQPVTVHDLATYFDLPLETITKTLWKKPQHQSQRN